MADNAVEYGGTGAGGDDSGGGGYDGGGYDPGLDFGSYADPYQYVPIDSTLAGQADSGNVGDYSGDVGDGSGDVGSTPDPNSSGGVKQGDDPSADNYDPALDPTYGDNSSNQNAPAPEQSQGFFGKLADSMFGSKSGGASPANSSIPAIATGSGKQASNNNSSGTDPLTNALNSLLKMATAEKAVAGAVSATKQAINGTPAGRPPVAVKTSGSTSSTLVIIASIASIAGLALIFWDRE